MPSRPPLEQLACCALGAAGAVFATAACGWRSESPPRAAGGSADEEEEPDVFELKGEYYQVLGHGWCHETKDFKVIYRPLYHCPAAADRFEAHRLAVSHFSRWEAKFRRVDLGSVPAEARALLLPGPFCYDPRWAFAREAAPTGAVVGSTRSGMGSRSHEPCLLEHLIGDWRAWGGALVAALAEAGLDARQYEMDHICFRCSSVTQYRGETGCLLGLLCRVSYQPRCPQI